MFLSGVVCGRVQKVFSTTCEASRVRLNHRTVRPDPRRGDICRPGGFVLCSLFRRANWMQNCGLVQLSFFYVREASERYRYVRLPRINFIVAFFCATVIYRTRFSCTGEWIVQFSKGTASGPPRTQRRTPSDSLIPPILNTALRGTTYPFKAQIITTSAVGRRKDHELSDVPEVLSRISTMYIAW